jgi:hypothetical protein
MSAFSNAIMDELTINCPTSPASRKLCNMLVVVLVVVQYILLLPTIN